MMNEGVLCEEHPLHRSHHPYRGPYLGWLAGVTVCLSLIAVLTVASYGEKAWGINDLGDSDPEVSNFLQQKPQSCGLAALRFWLAMHGRAISEAELERRVNDRHQITPARIVEQGYSLADLVHAAKTLGFEGSARWLTQPSSASLEFPFIVLLAGQKRPHYLVVIDRRSVFDPAAGYREMSLETLLRDSSSSVVALSLSQKHPAG